MDAFDQTFSSFATNATLGQVNLAAPKKRTSLRAPSPTTPLPLQPHHTGASSYEVFSINSLSPEEKAAYGQLFSIADSEGAGVVSGKQAVPFLSRAKLSQSLLRTIWNLADPDGQGFLTPHKFAAALKLVAVAQQGIEPSLANLHIATPIPVFEGIPVPSLQPSTNKPNYSVISALAAEENQFTITPEERAKFETLFVNSGAIGGYLDGEKAKMVFLRSRLPHETLAKLWGLVNPNRPGFMNMNEFVISMHFIQGLMNGTLTTLPSSIPSSLLSILSRSSSPVSPGVAFPAAESAMSGSLPAASPASSAPRSQAPIGTSPNLSAAPPAVARHITGSSIVPVTRHMTGAALSIVPSPGDFVPIARHMTGVSRTSNSEVSHSVAGPAVQDLPRFMSNKCLEADASVNRWKVTAEEKAKFDRFFDSIDQDRRGFITGDEAVRFFTNSKLPQPVLGQIWEITDRDRSGRLYQAEFEVAMHLIQKAIAGIPVPSALPPGLAEYISRAEAPTTAPTAARHTSEKAQGSANLPPVASTTVMPAQNVSLATRPSLFDTQLSDKAAVPSLGNEYTDLSNDMEELRKDITGFTTRSSDVYAKRSGIDANLANLQAQKKDLETRLVQAKALYDQEKQLLSEVEEALASQQATNAELLAQVERLERQTAEIQIESEGVRDAAAVAERASEELRRKIAELEAHNASLKAGIEQFRQQEELARKTAPSSSQLAAAEKVRDDLSNVFASLSNQQQQQPQRRQGSHQSVQSVTGLPSSLSAPASASSAIFASESSPKSGNQLEPSVGTGGTLPVFENPAKDAFRSDDWTTVSHPQPSPGAFDTAPASSAFGSTSFLKPKVDTSVIGGDAPVPKSQTSAPAQFSSLGDDDFFGSALRPSPRPASSDAARPDLKDPFGFPDFSMDSATKITTHGTAQGSPPGIGQDFASSFGSFGASGVPPAKPADSAGPFGSSFPEELSSSFGSTFSDSFGGPAPNLAASPAIVNGPQKISVVTGKQPGCPPSASSQPSTASPGRSAGAEQSFESRFPPLEKDLEFDDQFGSFGSSKPATTSEKSAAAPAQTQPQSLAANGASFLTKSDVSSSSTEQRATLSKSPVASFSPVSAPGQEQKGEAGSALKRGNSLHRVVSRDEFEAAFTELELPASKKGVSTAATQSSTPSTKSLVSAVPNFGTKFDMGDFEFNPKFDATASASINSTRNRELTYSPESSSRPHPPPLAYSQSAFGFEGQSFRSSGAPTTSTAAGSGGGVTNFDDVFSASMTSGSPPAGAGTVPSFTASDPFGFSNSDPFFAVAPQDSGWKGGSSQSATAPPQRRPSDIFTETNNNSSSPSRPTATSSFSFDDAFGSAVPFSPPSSTQKKGNLPKISGAAVATPSSNALDVAEDIESVKNLLNLGFPRQDILEALESLGYDETLATSYLLKHQEKKGF